MKILRSSVRGSRRHSASLIFLSALVGIFAAVSGCGSCSEPSPEYVRIAISSDPASLDPAHNTDFSGGVVASKIFNGLVRFEGSEIVGDLADSWTISEDGRSYRFRIRGGVAFHDGSTLDAASVARSFARIIDSATASPRRWVFEGVEKIEAVSPTELTIALVAPSPSLLARLTMPAGYVIALPDPAVPKPKIVGTGPFSLESWEEGARIRLKRNDAYFAGAAGVVGLEYQILTEPMTALSLFKQGSLEIMELPPAQFPRFEKEIAAVGSVQKARELAVVYVAINNDRFKDPRVREAFGLAVDRAGVIGNLFNGLGTPATGPLPPALSRLERTPPPFDAAKAKSLLAASGFDFGKEYVFLRSSKASALEPSEAIAGFLRDIGIKVVIEPLEFASLREKMNRSEFDFAYQNWYGDYPDAENFLHPLFHSSNVGGAGNRARFRSPEADAAIEAVRKDHDPASRAAAVEKAEREVVAGHPWILLWYPETAVGVSNRLEGYRHPEIFNADKGTGYRVKGE